MALCIRCKVNPCEDFGDEYPSLQCNRCNDRDIERNQNRAEWNAYHDEPCPEIELSKSR